MSLALISTASALPAPGARPEPPAPRTLALPTRRAATNPWRDLTTRERDLLFHKRDWARAVHGVLATERHGRRLYTVDTAVAAVSAPDKWPTLAGAGQNGGSWMSGTNYRRTVKALTSGGLPRWDCVERLIKGYRGGRPSLVADNPEFVQDVLALWLNPRQPALSECWRKVAAVYRRAGWGEAALPPTASIQHHVSRHVSPTLVERYRGGAKQYADTVRGHIRRRWDEVEVGDVFCADHRISDYWARAQGEDGEWVAKRLYCSVIEDLRSRYRVHAILYADQYPNHRIVAEMLWNAIRANGGHPPRIFYIDNGKDFRKAGLTEPVRLRTADGAPVVDPATGAAYEHSVCRELGIQIKLSRGYNGREKPVEGSFGMDARLHDRGQVAFTGNTPVERARLNGEHYSGDVARLPSEQQAREAFGLWLDEFHALPTKSRLCPAETRGEAWRTMRRPTRGALTPEQLDYAFLIPQALCPLVGHTPAGTGGVRFAGWTYSHAELRRQGLWGRPVMVKTSWADAWVAHGRGAAHPPRVFVFHPDGRFVCQAMADGTVAAFAETEAERAELGAHCHVIAAAAAMDTAEFQGLTGRTRMIADPAEVLGRLPTGEAGRALLAMPPATPPRPRLALASGADRQRPAVSAVRGADSAALMAAIEDSVFCAPAVAGADRSNDEDASLIKLMEEMGA